MTAHVIAFGSSKGGVGKTAGAVNLAAALAIGEGHKHGLVRRKPASSAGRRVLVVDMDRQQSAGDSLGVRGVPDGTTYGMAIAGQPIDLSSCIYQVPFPIARGRLDVMPTTPYDYELAAANLMNYPDNGLRVVEAVLEPLLDDYDYIILDLRPELSHFASSAMVAANAGVVIPVTSEITTAVHLHEVQEHIQYLADAAGEAAPQVLGVLRGRWDSKSEEGRMVGDALSGISMNIFNTVIPAHRIVSKSFAMASGPVVTSYPKSPATARFHELAAEIANLVEVN